MLVAWNVKWFLMYFSEVPLRIRTGEYPCSTVQLVKLYEFSTLICLLKNHQKHYNKFQPGNAIFQELILISSLIEVFGQQIMKGWATLIESFLASCQLWKVQQITWTPHVVAIYTWRPLLCNAGSPHVQFRLGELQLFYIFEDVVPTYN